MRIEKRFEVISNEDGSALSEGLIDEHFIKLPSKGEALVFDDVHYRIVSTAHLEPTYKEEKYKEPYTGGHIFGTRTVRTLTISFLVVEDLL